jgi:hypothetical protein
VAVVMSDAKRCGPPWLLDVRLGWSALLASWYFLTVRVLGSVVPSMVDVAVTPKELIRVVVTHPSQHDKLFVEFHL